VRILGIDPGIGRTGWAIVDFDKNTPKAIAYGCIETTINGEMPARLLAIKQELERIIASHNPQALGIEDLFFANNAKTAFAVGQARGVVLLLAAEHNLSVGIYTPLQVKSAITGYGKAEKAQVGKMVKVLLHLEAVPKPDDTADALAIALTYAFSSKMKQK